MKIRYIPCALTLALSVAALPAAAQEAQEGPPGVVNFTRVDATVACAGATPVEALSLIKADGFASVINLRREGEEGANIAESKAEAAAIGLRYVHVPFDSQNPDPAVVEAFLAAVKDPANQPAFIHCGSANRVGSVWYIKRVLQDGWTEERAMEEAVAIGLRSPNLKEFATEYARQHRQ